MVDTAVALNAFKDYLVLFGFVLGGLLLLVGFALDKWRSGGELPESNAFLADFFKVLGAGTIAGAIYLAYLRSLL